MNTSLGRANPLPLVSVGIPTFNRAGSLAKAIDSVLQQTHAAIELIVSDNGSNDRTRELCLARAREDPRLRYLHSAVNRGPIENFNRVISEMQGEYVMLLADDDWIDTDYVARCVEELRTFPDHALVGGLARYVDRDGKHVSDGRPVRLTEDDPSRRVRCYLREVEDNGIFYGLMRHDSLMRAAPMRDVLAADWLLVAGVVFDGKARTIGATRVNRTTGGTSRSIAQIMRASPTASPFQRRVPFLYTAATVFGEIGWRSDAYKSIGTLNRLWLAVRGGWSAMRWLGSLWLLVGPFLVRGLTTRVGQRLRRPFSWLIGRFGRSYADLPPL